MIKEDSRPAAKLSSRSQLQVQVSAMPCHVVLLHTWRTDRQQPFQHGGGHGHSSGTGTSLSDGGVYDTSGTGTYTSGAGACLCHASAKLHSKLTVIRQYPVIKSCLTNWSTHSFQLLVVCTALCRTVPIRHTHPLKNNPPRRTSQVAKRSNQETWFQLTFHSNIGLGPCLTAVQRYTLVTGIPQQLRGRHLKLQLHIPKGRIFFRGCGHHNPDSACERACAGTGPPHSQQSIETL